MPPPYPLSWADAPPYHYHGTTFQPTPTTKGDDDEDAEPQGDRRSLWIGGLLAWMDEDYLYCCFTRSPEVQAMKEMNGAYCSTRPIRTGPAPNNKTTGPASNKKTFVQNTQGTDSNHDPNNSRLFVGHLDQSITDEDLMQAFSPYGELVHVKVLAGKGCGFVTYSNRASAEEAMKMLNGSQLGSNTVNLSWGRRPNKQDQQNGGRYGHPKCFDTSGFGWSPQDPNAYAQTGHPGYGYYQQQLPTVQ